MLALILYLTAAAGVVVAMIVGSHFIGERGEGRAVEVPYESGVHPTGPAFARVPAHFYMVALLFVVFDLEAVFLFAWAVTVEEAGWTALGGVIVFAMILAAGLAYEWRQGALTWGAPQLCPRPPAPREVRP